MRKITKEISESFRKGFSKKISNTETDGVSVWLHGNRIAWRNQDNTLSITLAGWGTPTTRERLNGILEAHGITYRVAQLSGSQIIKNSSNEKSFGFEFLPYSSKTIITFFSDDEYINGYKFSFNESVDR